MLVTSNMVHNVACSNRNCSYQSLFAVILLQADFALQLFNNLIPCCPTRITVKPRYHLIFFIEFHSPLQISRITDALFFTLRGTDRRGRVFSLSTECCHCCRYNLYRISRSSIRFIITALTTRIYGEY